MAGLAGWVSDRLHDILGLSDRQVAEFMIELATRSKSPEELKRKLRSSGAIEINSDVDTFAAELWRECAPEKGAERSSELLRGSSVGEHAKSRAHSKKTSRHIRSRRTTEEESDDEGGASPSRDSEGSDSDEWEK